MNFSELVDCGLKVIAAWLVLFLIQIPLRKGEHPIARTVVFVIKVILIPVAALYFVAIEWKYGYTHGDLVAAAYLVLIGDVAASVLEYLLRRIVHIKDRRAGKGPSMWKLQCILSFLLLAGITYLGVTGAWNVEKRTDTWQADGLTREHTFAFLSDVHAGSAQSIEQLDDVVDWINMSMPEFVILGGDITDELTSKEEMIAAYQTFAKLEMPVYFVFGNHDRQPNGDKVGKRTYTDAELAAALKEAGIRVLRDEYVRIDEDLVLLGREDMSRPERKAWADLVNPEDEGTYALIVADHSPYDKEQLKEEVSALQVSGHTHAGQLWPLKTVYTLLRLPAYGEFQEEGTRLLVSAGESCWMLPLRTEEHCQWHLITLKP